MTQFSRSSIFYCSLFAHSQKIKITFIKVASLKIDFYFEVFMQLKNHVLIFLTGAT